MSQTEIYQSWKPTVLGEELDVDRAYGAQCTDVVLSLAQAYFPGVAWPTLIPPVSSAKLLGSHHNDEYFEWVPNDHNNPNQLPPQGAIMVFDATPQSGYANTFNNLDGHTGGCDSASPSGYSLIQQNAPNSGQAVNVTAYSWKFRPCLGWLIPRLTATPVPVPPPTPTGQSVTLPAWVTSWAAYKVGSGLRKGTSDQVGTLLPSKFGGLTYDILNWVGTNAVNIQTQNFGVVTIWVANTDAQIH